MHPKLYSDSHMIAAKKIFPERVSDSWCNTQWTDDEINACKLLEYRKFINNPSLETYPGRELFNKIEQREELHVLEDFLDKYMSVGAVLSVGCGGAEKEFFLAKKFSKVQFVCIDNAPYIEELNTVAAEMGISNIYFRCHDLRNGPIGKFDLVFSMSVIYCIPDDCLTDFFNILLEQKYDDGFLVVGRTSNLPIIDKIYFGLRSNQFKKGCNLKQTVWLRPIPYILKKIPMTLRLLGKYDLYHYRKNSHFFCVYFLKKLFL